MPPPVPQPLPSVCPCPLRSCQRHQKGSLSADCIHLCHGVVISPQTSLVTLDPRSPLPAQRSVPVLAAFRTFSFVLDAHLVHQQLNQPCDHSLFSIYKGNNQARFNISSHLCQADLLSFRQLLLFSYSLPLLP